MTPADGATGVAVTISPTATFSEAMTAVDGSRATTVTLVRPGDTGAAVAAAVDVQRRDPAATLNPTADLDPATTAYVRDRQGRRRGVKDAAGIALAADRTWTFTDGGRARYHAPDGHRHDPGRRRDRRGVRDQPDGHVQRGDDRRHDHSAHDRHPGPTRPPRRRGRGRHLQRGDPAATLNPTADLLAGPSTS